MNVRDSKTDPLRIDWLSLCGRDDLGITFAPGRHGPSSYGFEWRRDLAADLDQFRGVDALVCLMERHEIDRFISPDYLDAVAARGIHPIWFPVPDLGVPSKSRARQFATGVGRRLLAGERVVLHCLGGLGRSGTMAGIVARWLAYSELETRRMLTAARGPRCPETPRQEQTISLSW